MLPTTTPSAIVLLHSVNKKACAKTFYMKDDRVAVRSYGKESIWNAEAVDASSLRALLGVIKNAGKHTIAIVGQLKDEEQRERIYRRKYDPGASLTDAERSWLPIDIDDMPVEGDNDRARLESVRSQLPEPFRDVSFVFQFTSSYQMDDNAQNMRCRLWFLLDEPVATPLWRHYFRGKDHLDPALYSCNQPIYICPPTFKGVPDPVKKRYGIFPGERDAVPVASLQLEEAREAQKKLTAAPTISRLDIEPDEKQIAEAVEDILGQTPMVGRHNWALAATCELYGLGADPQLIMDTFDECLRLHGRDPDPGEAQRAIAYAARQATSGKLRSSNPPLSKVLPDIPDDIPKGPPEPELEDEIADPDDPDELDDFDALGRMLHRDHTDTMNARIFVRELFGERGYIAWGASEYVWTGKGWRAFEDHKALKGLVRRFGPDLTKAKKDSCVDAVRDLGHREGLALPCWVTDENTRDWGQDTAHTISLENGLLDIRDALIDGDSALRPHVREFFSTSHLPFKYDSTATCPRWEAALSEWFPGDPSALREIQKMFGYLMTTDTSQQKIFVLTGESRAGKGVVTDTLSHVLGGSGAVGTLLSSFGEPFALQSLLGKNLCIINEANASRRGDITQAAIDRIKAISGEDDVEVNVKYGGTVHTKLPIRLVMVCNQMPSMEDISSAITNRMQVFHFKHTFVGREDTKLKHKLRAEAAGIFNWALAGYGMLLEDGAFFEVESAREHKREIRTQASPGRAFLEECVVKVGLADHSEYTQDIFDAYRAWAEDQGMDRKLTKQSLMMIARNMHPHAEFVHSKGKNRPAYIAGLKLNQIGREFCSLDTSEWIDK